MKEDININEWLRQKQHNIKIKTDKKRMAHVIIVVHSSTDPFPDHLITNINEAVQSFRSEVASKCANCMVLMLILIGRS